MDEYVIQRLYEALGRCRKAIQEVLEESDDMTLALGQELGATMVIDEVEQILDVHL